ncbi:MAG: alpha/beta fold hydrolase [Actinomycetota bacterium]|nr:alpha/beta fold hydrolase [Actinomycetota bacterium]
MPQVEFPAADDVRLEGNLATPDEPKGGAAVMCHPHPRHGGSMDSWMMPVLQRALADDGWPALRFNFRGVGNSEGSYEQGEGELKDVSGAVDYLLEQAGGDATLLIGGWSFGAHTTLRYALGDKRVAGWFGIGLPYRTREIDVPELSLDALARWTVPKLFLHGSRDQIAGVEAIEELVHAAGAPKRLRIVDGGDHFLAAHGDVLGEELRSFARLVLQASGRGET